MKPLNEHPTPETDWLNCVPRTREQWGDKCQSLEQRLAATRDLLACINASQCLPEELHAEIRETLAATK